MSLINEKIHFLKQEGLIHIFRRGNTNFLFFKEKNKTFSISDELYIDLKVNQNFQKTIEKQIVSILESVRVVKSYSFNFNTLYSSHYNIPLDILLSNILGFFQTEIVFQLVDDVSLLNLIDYNSLNIIPIVLFDVSEIQISGLSGDQLRTIFTLSENLNYSEVEAVSSDKNHTYRLMYSLEKEQEIFSFLAKVSSPILLKITPEVDPIFFFNFLRVVIKEPAYRQKVFFLEAISKYLMAEFIATTKIQYFDGNNISNVENSICKGCWAQHLCWSLKFYDSFNIDVRVLEKQDIRCNFIRLLIEDVFLVSSGSESDRSDNNKIVNTLV